MLVVVRITSDVAAMCAVEQVLRAQGFLDSARLLGGLDTDATARQIVGGRAPGHASGGVGGSSDDNFQRADDVVDGDEGDVFDFSDGFSDFESPSSSRPTSPARADEGAGGSGAHGDDVLGGISSGGVPVVPQEGSDVVTSSSVPVVDLSSVPLHRRWLLQAGGVVGAAGSTAPAARVTDKSQVVVGVTAVSSPALAAVVPPPPSEYRVATPPSERPGDYGGSGGHGGDNMVLVDGVISHASGSGTGSDGGVDGDGSGGGRVGGVARADDAVDRGVAGGGGSGDGSGGGGGGSGSSSVGGDGGVVAGGGTGGGVASAVRGDAAVVDVEEEEARPPPSFTLAGTVIETRLQRSGASGDACPDAFWHTRALSARVDALLRDCAAATPLHLDVSSVGVCVRTCPVPRWSSGLGVPSGVPPSSFTSAVPGPPSLERTDASAARLRRAWMAAGGRSGVDAPPPPPPLPPAKTPTHRSRRLHGGVGDGSTGDVPTDPWLLALHQLQLPMKPPRRETEPLTAGFVAVEARVGRLQFLDMPAAELRAGSVAALLSQYQALSALCRDHL
jgi:hypothetical protein